MLLKKFIGEIMRELGFITREQLEESLRKQREIFEAKTLPEFLQRDRLVREARIAREIDSTPMLGQILMDMGFATDKEIQTALEHQEGFIELYKSIGSEKLGISVEIISMINSTLNLAEVLSHLMRHANRVTNSVSSTLMILDHETGELVFSVPTGPNSEQLTDIRLPTGKGIAGWVAQHGQYVLVADAKKDPRFYPEIDKLTGLETKSLLCVPLKAKSKLIGVLEVVNKADGSTFTQEDALLLSIFASQAAMAIENARLYGELKDKLEEERRMQKKLAETEKFGALGQMASGLAHDFNNILGAIMGYVEMALLDIPEKNQASTSLEQVLAASNRAKDLVRQILAFSRKSEEEHKPILLSTIIKEVLNLLRASIPATIEIVTKIQAENATMMADPTQIHQVLMNLCTNANHSMRDTGGMLEITLSAVELGPDDIDSYPELTPGSYLRLSVKDTGHGMDEQTLKQAFDPYFTTKEKDLGTGLGLAVVRGIVKNHGGAISIQSEPGKGTSIEVLFPRIDEEVLIETENFRDLPKGRERILFVDDEEPLSNLGKLMLERLGYRVIAKTCPKEALSVFEKTPEDFNLVITDMTMPNMTGDALAEKLKEIRPDIPVILCTGHSDLVTKEKALSKDIKDFLMKPLSMRHLATSVRKILDDS
ncbi:MAG: response regulator [Deltaproteobacteria bacterium]|nr:response regulator [Deltaproteobacteria bacterium]MBW1993976.1 response regulator [Deltaproteobacteria bacterium]MBW2151663.1 response regulator [Deltaproteobacteria bacterium]